MFCFCDISNRLPQQHWALIQIETSLSEKTIKSVINLPIERTEEDSKTNLTAEWKLGIPSSKIEDNTSAFFLRSDSQSEAWCKLGNVTYVTQSFFFFGWFQQSSRERDSAEPGNSGKLYWITHQDCGNQTICIYFKSIRLRQGLWANLWRPSQT